MKPIPSLIFAACLAGAALSQPAFAAKIVKPTPLSRVALNPQPLPPKARPPTLAPTRATNSANQRGIIIVGGRSARVAAPR